MGEPDVNKLGDSLTPAQLTEWWAYYHIEPWDGNLHSAALQATLVDSTNDIVSVLTQQEMPPRATVSDFMLGWRPKRNKKTKQRPRQSPESMLATFKAKFGKLLNK